MWYNSNLVSLFTSMGYDSRTIHNCMHISKDFIGFYGKLSSAETPHTPVLAYNISNISFDMRNRDATEAMSASRS